MYVHDSKMSFNQEETKASFLWPKVYFFMRCGKIKEGVQFLREEEKRQYAERSPGGISRVREALEARHALAPLRNSPQKTPTAIPSTSQAGTAHHMPRLFSGRSFSTGYRRRTRASVFSSRPSSSGRISNLMFVLDCGSGESVFVTV